MYLTGFAVGSLPLLYYLIKNRIVSEFVFWVIRFNQQRIIKEKIAGSMVFPIAIGFMGAWGAYLLLSRYHKFKDNKSLILFIAFCLSTFSSLSGTPGRCYLGFWYILCAILSSGCNIQEISEKVSSLIRKSIVSGLFLVY